MRRSVYLDHHATTPVDPRVLERMLPYFSERYGNASSRGHRYGWEAAAAVDEGRRAVAGAIGAGAEDVVFTSGATEAINMAILGAHLAAPGRDHVVATAVEHRAVLDVLEALGRRGCRVDLVPVDGFGMVDPADVASRLSDRTLLVAVILANNEVGTINPVAAIGRICAERGVPLLVDASQALGRIPIDVDEMGAGMMAVSGHKVYGPKGVGALYRRSSGAGAVRIEPIVYGGGHEAGLRSGTLNVPGIVGFGAAVSMATTGMAEESTHQAALRDAFQEMVLAAIPECRVNGHPVDRLPNNLHVSIRYVEAEAVLMALTDVAASTGSACTSASTRPSHVLQALGLDRESLHGSLRFGLGRGTTRDDVEYAVKRLAAEVERLRRLSPRWAAGSRGAGEGILAGSTPAVPVAS